MGMYVSMERVDVYYRAIDNNDDTDVPTTKVYKLSWHKLALVVKLESS